MRYKYFQITEKSTLELVVLALQSMKIRDLAVKSLAQKLGAYDCLQYRGGEVAAFKFKATPDKSVWKKSKYGFLPKAKTDEQQRVKALPELVRWQSVLELYGFGDEMIIGEREHGRTGFPLHSSYLKGRRKTLFYVIVVPYTKEFDRKVHKSLVELKEWEVLKAIEEG
jgi:hypothetical protein